MAISINGTTGISGVDGSASTPALQGNDSNTGISFGTDEVAINTNGTQRALVDSSGNINIDSGTFYVDAVNNRVGVGNSSPGFSLTVGNATATVDTALRAHSAGAVTHRYDIDTIGTLTVGFNNSGSTINNMPTGIAGLWMQQAYPIIFATTGSERARITSGGEVYIAGTSDQGAYNLQVNGTGVWGAGAYVNGSDERLKEDIQPLADASEVLQKLRPVSFKYKADYSRDQSIQPGFIAQELQEAMAGQVYLDGVVQQGPEYLNVAYQGLIPVLTKALQESITRIEALEAEVQALKGGN